MGDLGNNFTKSKSNLHILETHHYIFELVNVNILCGIISIIGINSNMINLIVFYRQGLDTTINISLFALAISDLSSLILQLWHNVVSLFQYTTLPIVNEEFKLITAFAPHESFARLTCSITVYITAERCLCVVFPLTIGKIITAKRTTLIIVSIYIVTLSGNIIYYSVFYLDWQFYPEVNQTLLSAVFTDARESVHNVMYLLNSFFAVLSITAVVIFTTILIMQLQKVSTWRLSANVTRNKSEMLSNRDKTAVTMVVVIAIILVACYIPSSILCVITVAEPEFNVWGIYAYAHHLAWSIAIVFENINSSVNILLYLKMSSKYRSVFTRLFIYQKTSRFKQHR